MTRTALFFSSSLVLALAAPAHAQEAEAGGAASELAVPAPPEGSTAPPDAAPGGAPPPAASAPRLSDVLAPLVDAAERDLAEGRPAHALARASLAVEMLREGAPIRVRADGLRLLAQQRVGDAEAPPVDVVLAPLVAQAELELPRGQLALGIARLDFVLGRAPEGSPLALRAAALRTNAQRRAGARPTPPPGSVAPTPAPVDVERPPPAGGPATQPADPTLRGTGEVVELYITSAAFGALTGAYITFMATAGASAASAFTYALTMLGGGALLAVGTLAIDLASANGGMRTGVGPSISGGFRLGLASGLLLMGAVDPRSCAAGGGGGWCPADDQALFSLTWVSMAAGGVLGAILGFGAEPTVDQARSAEGVAWWSGLLGLYVGLIAQPADTRVYFQVPLGALGGGALLGTILAATGTHFSARRTLMLDVGFIAGSGVGAVVSLGILAYANPGFAFEPWHVGLPMGLGAIAGWLTTLLLTDGWDAPEGEPRGQPDGVTLTGIGVAPVEGGAAVTLGGSFL